mgnify:CR=1 FL=1
MCIKVGIKKCSGANQPVVEMVRWTVVSPTHQGSNPGARIISGFISGIFGDALLVGGDIPVDDEAPTVAS